MIALVPVRHGITPAGAAETATTDSTTDHSGHSE